MVILKTEPNECPLFLFLLWSKHHLWFVAHVKQYAIIITMIATLVVTV
jgi:hypothetical protein